MKMMSIEARTGSSLPPRHILVVEPRSIWREGMIAMLRARISSVPVSGGEDWVSMPKKISGAGIVITSAEWVVSSLVKDRSFRNLDFSDALRWVCIGEVRGVEIPGAWNLCPIPDDAHIDTLLDAVCGEWRPLSPGLHYARLTGREREVVVRLCAGESFKEVAEGLGVGISSVQCYKKRAMNKLGVKNFAELCRISFECGGGI